ncbi:LOW QUALITY PROTEIN: uncharacterized protein LOC126549715 [Aphis gossypii]|uniref:LOW QUALITY PROTEIN: uncharacterized protein LOC126549715 n=1 Tax=Aphis gossypii TaxID=80765 RepID=UPI002159564F|nr:LOW QUALITY PROTEIN: uncharacterized protein LOC126549715 [Aphis gossypii]
MSLSAGDRERFERALKRNIIKRDQAVEQFSILMGLVNTAKTDESGISILQPRIDDIEILITDVRLYQDAILDQLIELDRDSEFPTVHNPVGKIALDHYYAIKAISVELGINNRNITPTPTTHNIQLPKIQLPSFDGQIIQWRSFRDTFTSLVHDNSQLSQIQKFHYLLSAVSGSAATTVKSVPLTDANYPIVWQSLNDRFDNKRVLLGAHMDALFRISPMKTESLGELKHFLTTFQENICIKALEIDDFPGFFMFYIASRVLDPVTRQAFEFEYHAADVPTFDMLADFVQIRCQVLQNSYQVSSTNTGHKTHPKPKVSLATSSTTESLKCVLCKSTHMLYQCPKFLQQNVKQRFRLVKTNRVCTNCLGTSHKTSECKSTYTCRHCASKHHSLLHMDTAQARKNSSPTNRGIGVSQSIPLPSAMSTPIVSDTVGSTPFVGTSSSKTNVVLGTAVIRIRNNCGQLSPVRVLIDTGSQISVITTACVARLCIKRCHSNTAVMGLSQMSVSTTKGSTKCTIIPRHSATPEIYCEPVILSRITGPMPTVQLPSKIRTTYSQLLFADPYFDVPGQIDFLLGADIYPYILGPSCQVLHTPNCPSAFETHLGWIIVGQSCVDSHTPPVSLLLAPEPSIDHLIQQFWTVEEPVNTNNLFTIDQQCEDHFLRTTTRDSTGRFSLALPFNNDASCLGNSHDMAISRFYNLERKLLKDPLVYDHYRLFMLEYEQLGHMKLASRPGKYYIPHHAVVKRNGAKMKLRVVFDASAKSSSGKSLNDLLHVGPKLQTDITDLLHRCRFNHYIFTADICKMYRQIKINTEDCQYQHIFWRATPLEPLRDYELTTITYGLTSSPFQAIRVLHELEQNDGHLYPSTRDVLSTQTYVDDILTGRNSITDLLKLQDEVTQLLLRGGFELKKWSSNSTELLSKIPLDDQVNSLSFDPKDDVGIKILGLHWQPATDTFSYHTSSIPPIYTKRSVLSTIAKLYDPLGALAPMIFWAKCFMQLLWQGGLNWDDKLPPNLSDLWEQYSSELHMVSSIKICRHISTNEPCSAQLIGFADASEKGYGAVVYLRIIHQDGRILVHFITAKSKVAPSKIKKAKTTLTIPRLELCGALLLTQVLHRLINTFRNNISISAIQAWTDSSIVLSWLTSPHSSFKIFVTNRLAKIAELIPNCQWRHVASESNPADCVSRGLFPSQVPNHHLYWQGPQFLKLPESDWPTTCFQLMPASQLPEYSDSTKACLMTLPENEVEWFSRFSSLRRMQRVMVIIYRFINHARRLPSPFVTDFVSQEEVINAMVPIIRITQSLHFVNLSRVLQTTAAKIVPRSLAQLAPFIDDNKIIRVGGRLRHAALPAETKNPILLPKSSALTTLIIRHFHLTYFHAGPQLISSLLAAHYWIMSSRSSIRHVVFKCVVCARHRASITHPIMADLPASRVTPCRPFLRTGIDFAGPFVIAEHRRKNSRSIKCYLSIFVCMAVKAVHIEVVSDLSTSSFLAALQRFVARRGTPSDIYSDCGTNFKGADQQLRHMMSDPAAQTTYSNSILCKWHFNPPAAPHFGGLWEAAVKSTKYHLKRVMGNQRLTFEEMATLTCRIEALLNSRPITPISTDPNDYRALTPGHFLIGHPMVEIPELDVTHVLQNRLTRWELLRQMYQSFWKRWSTEYLSSLQRRKKWDENQPNLKIDDLVLVNMPNQPPIQWRLGRIQQIHPGVDGVVRVATVRTEHGTLTRPIVKLAILPVDK